MPPASALAAALLMAVATGTVIAGEPTLVDAGGSAPPAAPLPDFHDLASPRLDDAACMDELRRCCNCPGWDHYAIFDVLFLQRSNQAGNQPLAINSETGLPLLSVQDIQPTIGTGVRLFYGRLVTDRIGWEVGYTGIYGMFGEANTAGNDTITLPDPIGGEFQPANAVRATWLSTLNIAEANLFCYACCEECGPRCRRNCHCSSAIVGFVWAGLDEQSSLTAKEKP